MEEFFEIADPARLDSATLATSGFDSGFDWTKPLDDCIVIGKSLDGRLAGLIAFKRNNDNLCNDVVLLEVARFARHHRIASKLLAIVMLDSLDNPEFEGFVQLKSKYNGVQHFYYNLGGIPTGEYLIFYPEASRDATQRYLPLGGTITWINNKSQQN